MTDRELLVRRAEHHAAADQLTAVAVKTGKDLAGAELVQFNTHVKEIQSIDLELAKNQEVLGTARHWQGPGVPVAMPGQSVPVHGHGLPTMGRDAEGRPVPIFAKGQSIEAHVRQQRGGEDSGTGITLGELCRSMAIGGGRSEVRAALAEGSDSAGGVTVPTLLSSQIIDALRARSTAFQAGARTVMLETGKATTIATIASDPTATWRAENANVATSDMTFGSVSFVPKTLAVCVTASRELIEDSLNLSQALTTSLSKSFAAEIDRVALVGSGTGSEPKGCSKVSGAGSVSMGTNGAALTNWDPFVQALGTLRTANANDPTACILHPRSEQELNLLKDSQNRPLARPSAIQDLPFLVTSKLPINETQGSANTASRAIMGDFTELIVGVRHVLSIEMLREKYSDTLAYGFLAYLRADIAVAHAASFCNVLGIL
jgi:HK97 family phage major capsid protein